MLSEAMSKFLQLLTKVRINTTNNSNCFVGNRVRLVGGDTIVGLDGCILVIYWPPINAHRILKYDPHKNKIMLVGDDYGREQEHKWKEGCLSSDRVIIYFTPFTTCTVRSILLLYRFMERVHIIIFKDYRGGVSRAGVSSKPVIASPIKLTSLVMLLRIPERRKRWKFICILQTADRLCTILNLFFFTIAASY